MKNVFLVMIAVAMLTLSCKKDEAPATSSTQPPVSSGIYEVYVDDDLVAKGTSSEIGMLKDDQGNYTSHASISNGDEVSILAFGFSLKVGESVEMTNGGNQVTLSGIAISSVCSSEYLYSTSGTMTRTSASRITFDGECVFYTGVGYKISGFIESDAFKVIE